MKYIAKHNHLLKAFRDEVLERLEELRSAEHKELYKNEIKHLLCYLDYLERDLAESGWHECEDDF